LQASDLPERVRLVWAARHAGEFTVLDEGLLAAAADPMGWLSIELSCTGRLEPTLASAESKVSARGAAARSCHRTCPRIPGHACLQASLDSARTASSEEDFKLQDSFKIKDPASPPRPPGAATFNGVAPSCSQPL
jgi:hypothetical protein